MQYEVEVGGKLRQVTVARAAGAGGFAVTIDGRTFHVDAARVDAQMLSLLIDGAAPRVPVRSYEVTQASDAAGALTVRVGATPVAARKIASAACSPDHRAACTVPYSTGSVASPAK